MSDAPAPRAPIFRCAACDAIWRTETQRDLCCTARPLRARPWSYPVLVWTNRYLAGESIPRIAVDAGVSASTVNTYLNRAGVPLRGRKEREA